jgi:hypothetical protein
MTLNASAECRYSECHFGECHGNQEIIVTSCEDRNTCDVMAAKI